MWEKRVAKMESLLKTVLWRKKVFLLFETDLVLRWHRLQMDTISVGRGGRQSNSCPDDWCWLPKKSIYVGDVSEICKVEKEGSDVKVEKKGGGGDGWKDVDEKESD